MIKCNFCLKILLLIIFMLYNLNSKYYLKKELKRYKKDINEIEKYYNICNNQTLSNIISIKNINNPKISIISPLYNQEKYILRFIKSIQNQNFNDLEIIFVDDCSTDNSIQIIDDIKKIDKRIILIKHKKNKGTLISRNEGALLSKGEYLIFSDPDDILSNNILTICYEMAKKYNFDIIRYNLYKGNGRIKLDYIIYKLISKPIYQPELSSYLFYGSGKLEQIDYYITNKFIKKEIFIKTLNSIKQYYLIQFMIDSEDCLINFILHKIAKSFIFIKVIGYYYIINEKSITINSQSNFIKRLKSIFLYLKFIFENTKNNKIEKNICEYIFLKIYFYHNNNIINHLKKLTKDILFYKTIIDLYLNCVFISFETKIKLNMVKLAINEAEKKLKRVILSKNN